MSVRVNAEDRALLEEAAKQAHTTLSDFIRRKALEAAEASILDRSGAVIPAQDWDAFESWLERPAGAVPILQALAKRKPSWSR